MVYICQSKKKALKTTSFYIDVINAFDKAGGIMDCKHSSVLETREMPLWNNVSVTKDNVTFGSTLLKSFGINRIKHIVKQGKLISFKEIAEMCALRNINAGRMLGRLKHHVDYNLVEEKREGPATPLCNWLVIKDYNGEESAPMYLTKAKTNYGNLIRKKTVVPRVQPIWQNIFSISQDLDWSAIWISDFKNYLMDSDDKQFMYKLRHRILPTKDVLLKIGIVREESCPLCNVERETHEHIFIYCSHTLDAWIFVERLLSKYTGNKHFYLNDSNRILGYALKPVQAIVVAKLLRLIWNIRCKKVFNSYSRPAEIDIISQLKLSLKYFLRMEKNRLKPESFKNCYTRNNALCFTTKDEVSFNY